MDSAIVDLIDLIVQARSSGLDDKSILRALADGSLPAVVRGCRSREQRPAEQRPSDVARRSQ